jgi:hypothetical protein
MYKTYMKVLLLALALAFTSAQANAQATANPTNSAGTSGATAPVAPPSDPCTKMVGSIDGANSSSGQGNPDYTGYYNSDPKPDPKPQNPVGWSCANGRINFVVGIPDSDQDGYKQAHRHFGHLLMDKIPVTVVLNVDPSVEIDASSLTTQKVLSFNGSDFTLAKQGPGEPPAVQVQGPALRTREIKNEAGEVVGKQTRKIYVINLIVQTMVPKPTIVFNIDLRYAVGKTPDNKGWNWQAMTTPDFVLTFGNLFDSGEELLEGNLDAQQPRLSWMTVTMLAIGTFLLLLLPGTKFVKYVNRERPRKVIAPNRAAWKVFEAQYKDARKKGGFQRTHIRAIAHALRRYLGTLPEYPRMEALTILEMNERFVDEPNFATIKAVLELCERDLFGDAEGIEQDDTPTKLSAEQITALYDGLERLVPRPWDSK